ncbi:MAG TPA: T9SS type A sorting domain-containing protein [Chitinophagales bacterium]|nr:T9SS type A sorting domain-containing protein [Chitinophagales bacterium]
MKTQFAILLFCAFYFSNLNSTSAQSTFEKSYLDTIYGSSYGFLQPALDGGCALFGVCGPGTDLDFSLIKVDVNGNVQWGKYFGDSIRNIGYGFSQASDSGYIMVGQEYDMSGNQTPHLYIVKCDKNGNLQWSNYYNLNTSGGMVLQANDGGYVIGGTEGSGVAFILKTDSLGNVEWTTAYSPTHPFDLQKTSDNGYIMTGTTQFPDNTYSNVSLIKTDSAGNLLWSKSFGGTLEDDAYRVKQTADHGYIIAGSTSSFGESQGDIYLLKTDENGNLEWSKTYGNANANSAYDVQQIEGAGYLVAALNNPGAPNVYLIKTDGSGNLQWSKQWGAFDYTFVENMFISSQSTFLISGSGFNNLDYTKIYLLNIDTDNCLFENVNVTVTTAASFDTTGATPEMVYLTAHPADTKEHGEQIVEEVLCYPLNINETISSEPSFQIYPNPVTSQLNTSFNNYYQPYHLIITNFLGETLKNKMITGSESSIDVSQLPFGVYLATIKTAEGNFVKKFVRQ